MSYQPASTFITQYADDNGVPLSNGSISAYIAGTTTPTVMYSDIEGTEIGTSVSLNARGEPEVSGNTVMIWLADDITYKFVLKDSSGAVVWTVDDINVARVGGESGTVGNLTVTQDLTVAGAINAGPELSDVRPFKMGFTEWPYDFTPTAEAWTYDKINAHGDLITHHLKDGLPWQEAYDDDATYPAWIESAIAGRIAGTDPSKSVFLVIDCMDQNREFLIGEWGDEGQEARSGAWASRDFDSPEVIQAFINYSLNLIDRFEPDYFNYATEATEIYGYSADRFTKFVTFAAAVYSGIKAVHPDLPVMLSIILKTPGNAASLTTEQLFARVSNYTDIAGVSIYPYAFFTPFSDVRPDELAANWLTQIYSIAPGKPIAITETGWIGEDIVVPAIGLTATSTEEIQDQYLQMLMNTAFYLNAEFVVWWCIADFDEGWDSTLASRPEAALALVWKDIGLYDGDQQPRIALDTWDAWYARGLADDDEGIANVKNLNVLWEAFVGKLAVRGNIAADTIQANSSVTGRKFFALENITTDDLFINEVYNYGISTLVGNVTCLADLQAEEIAAEVLIAAPAIFIFKDDGTGAGYFDNVVASALLVTNDDNDAEAGIDILNVKSLTVSDSGTAIANIDNVSADDVQANTGDIDAFETNTLTVTGQSFLNLPTSAGASGTLWNDGGIVKVAP